MSVLKYNNNGTWEGLNIDHASTADSALYDADGNVISSTYLPLSAGSDHPLSGDLVFGTGCQQIGGVTFLSKKMTTATTISNSFTDLLNISADADATYIAVARIEICYTAAKTSMPLDLFRIVSWDSNNAKSGRAAQTCLYPTNSTATLYHVFSTVVHGYPKYGIDGAATPNNSVVGVYLELTRIA